MRKIEQFQITGMTLSGFKSYQEPIELTFGPQTVVTGGNGQGKPVLPTPSPSPLRASPFSGSGALTSCIMKPIPMYPSP